MLFKGGLGGEWAMGKKLDFGHPHALSCPLTDFECATVDILINPRSRQWNGDMVDGLFNIEEA